MIEGGRRWATRVVTAWSVLGLMAGVVLLGFTWLDIGGAGDLGLAMDSDHPHPRVDRVRYTLLGLSYLHGDEVLTGPHRALPLTLGWLALTALLMLGMWKRWESRPARRVCRASLCSLALVVVLGGLTLTLAGRQHNRMLQAPTLGRAEPVSMTSASLSTLHLWRCGRWEDDPASPGCQDRQRSSFPNPGLWAILATFLTAGTGLWRSSGDARPQRSSVR